MVSKRSIFIFNPETDYALAVGNTQYNPPAKIRNLRKDMQLIQALLAKAGDAIVVSSDFDISSYPHPSHLDIVKRKNLSLVPVPELPRFLQSASPHKDTDNADDINFSIQPWGWNHSLRKELISIGIDATLLPDLKAIDMLRCLSHRRTVIPFQKLLQELLPEMEIPVAREFDSVSAAIEFAEEHDEVYFKAPWSSSGRGVVRSGNMSKEKLKEWIGGFIRKQGSVTGEMGFVRKADFATEWRADAGKVTFIGYSLFETNPDGRYLGNNMATQEEIINTIKRLSPYWSRDIIVAQQKALENLIAPYYNGPIGIDMLIDSEGMINPCVEINLRMTMGMINLGIIS